MRTREEILSATIDEGSVDVERALADGMAELIATLAEAKEDVECLGRSLSDLNDRTMELEIERDAALRTIEAAKAIADDWNSDYPIPPLARLRRVLACRRP